MNNIMTFSKQLFPLFFLFYFILPLRHALNPQNCSSSYSKPLRCGPSEVPILFPFCDHPGFNLHCNNLNKTVLELPLSGTFLVQEIDYISQEIYINDPENCLPKRLLTFNISGSPFSYRSHTNMYTFLTCPNEVVSPSSYLSIPCLSNSTSTFYATSRSSLEETMLQSCKIVKRVLVPAISLFGESVFSSYVDSQSLSLEWNSPNCKECEVNNLRCGFKNKTSLEVKCLDVKKTDGYLSTKSMAIIICVSIFGGVILYNVCTACIRCHMNNSEDSNNPNRLEAIEAATVVQNTRGLDQSTIESYKKVELGESGRVSGSNGIVCPICLSEYASKETVRFIPECDHCFHVECIDVWLEIHGSCPLCRKTHAY